MTDSDPYCPFHGDRPTAYDSCSCKENPYLPEAPEDGKHIFVNGSYRCARCAVYNRTDSPPFHEPCKGQWAESGKMRYAAQQKWDADKNPQASGVADLVRRTRRLEADLAAVHAKWHEQELRIKAVLPDDCWITHDISFRCTNLIGGMIAAGPSAFTEEMCCLPCRIRRALGDTND